MLIATLIPAAMMAQSESDSKETSEISKEDDMRLFTSENKVWEMAKDIYDELAGLTYYAFRGTEEKNGKTYSRLCCIASAEGAYYIPKQEWLMGRDRGDDFRRRQDILRQ